MGAVAAIGEHVRVAGLALAGVAVLPAEHAEEVRRAWQALPGGVRLVLLTPAAAEALGPEVVAGYPPLTAVLPRSAHAPAADRGQPRDDAVAGGAEPGRPV